MNEYDQYGLEIDGHALVKTIRSATHGQLRTLSEPEKAWLASAVDGEGSIAFMPAGITKTGKKKWNVVWIAIFNTDFQYVEFPRKITGVGSIRVGTRKSKYRRKSVYRWEAKGYGTIHSILTAILPYLIIKKAKAELILSQIEGTEWWKLSENGQLQRSEICRRKWGKLTPDEKERRLAGMRTKCI